MRGLKFGLLLPNSCGVRIDPVDSSDWRGKNGQTGSEKLNQRLPSYDENRVAECPTGEKRGRGNRLLDLSRSECRPGPVTCGLGSGAFASVMAGRTLVIKRKSAARSPRSSQLLLAALEPSNPYGVECCTVFASDCRSHSRFTLVRRVRCVCDCFEHPKDRSSSLTVK